MLSLNKSLQETAKIDNLQPLLSFLTADTDDICPRASAKCKKHEEPHCRTDTWTGLSYENGLQVGQLIPHDALLTYCLPLDNSAGTPVY